MNINVLSYIGTTGYGYAGTNIVVNLVLNGHKVALFPIGGGIEVSSEYAAIINEARDNAGTYDDEAPSLRICHQNMLAEHVGKSKRIGFPFFELEDLTDEERHHMNRMDRVVVASHWAADVLKNNGVHTNICIVPLGVDRRIFNENLQITRLDNDFTVFVNVGKWEKRKGHDILLNAFCKAFDKSDKVLLKMLPYNPFIGSGNDFWIKKYMKSAMASRIQISPYRVQGQGDVSQFIAGGDCAVFPSRGEAWNHELLEAMSCGLECVATHWSGHTEYANEGNCKLIDITRTERAIDNVWFHGQGRWAHFGDSEEEQLIEHMRDVHRRKQTGELMRNENGIATARVFNWTTTANALGAAVK